MDPGYWIAIVIGALLVAAALYVLWLAFWHGPPVPWSLTGTHPIVFPWTREISYTFDPERIDAVFRRELALEWEWPWPPKWIDPVEMQYAAEVIEDTWATYYLWPHWRPPVLPAW